VARQVADIIAQVSHEHLLRGNRLIALLHSQDRALDLGRLGGHDPWWQTEPKR
jgi:hypothetical protein